MSIITSQTGHRYSPGLAYDHRTELRNSSAVSIIEGTDQRGARVIVYDPVSEDSTLEHFSE